MKQDGWLYQASYHSSTEVKTKRKKKEVKCVCPQRGRHIQITGIYSGQKAKRKEAKIGK